MRYVTKMRALDEPIEISDYLRQDVNSINLNQSMGIEESLRIIEEKIATVKVTWRDVKSIRIKYDTLDEVNITAYMQENATRREYSVCILCALLEYVYSRKHEFIEQIYQEYIRNVRDFD